jgi:hypothetical protein
MATPFPITIDFTPPNRHGYAKGGLAQKAEEVRQAVDNRDTVLIHVNPEEYEFIKQRFGPPKINPKTGIPQFGWFSDWVAPVVTVGANLLGGDLLGSAGSAVSDALGLGLSDTAAQALGSGLLGAGVGGLTGGAKGALTYGALGAAAPYALNALGLTGNDGVLSGLGLGSTAANTAATAASSSPSYPAGEMANLAELSKSAGTTGGSEGILGSLGGSSILKAAPLLLVGAALGGAGKSTSQAQPTQAQSTTDSNTKTPLSNVQFTRTQANPSVTKRYGYGPAAQFFQNNQLPSSGVVTAAEGRYVRGGGTGTSDSIPAKLSDGEYVIDAQTVSMLGDGSSDAGAKKLDEMRHAIRKQKGGALSKGKFAPNAKSPLSYMKGA